MPIVSEQWIEQSLGRLESLEQERVELGQALARAEERHAELIESQRDASDRLASLEQRARDVIPALDKVERRERELEQAAQGVSKRIEALVREHAELVADRERIAEERAKLNEEHAWLEQAGRDVPADLETTSALVERIGTKMHDVGRTRDTMAQAVSALDREIAGLYSALNAVAEGEAGVPADAIVGDETRPPPESEALGERDHVVMSGVIEVPSLEAASEPVREQTAAGLEQGDGQLEDEDHADQEDDDAGNDPPTCEEPVPRRISPVTTAPLSVMPDPLADHPIRVRAMGSADDSARHEAEGSDDAANEAPHDAVAQTSPPIRARPAQVEKLAGKLVLSPLPRPRGEDPVLPPPPTVSNA